jgi:hypothetical protein
MKFIKSICYLVLIFTPDNNYAQVFDSEFLLSRESIVKPYKLIEVDLDSDGFKDIVVAGVMPDNISWYRNTGNGNFAEKQVIYTSTDSKTITCSVASYDFDNDGDEDLIAYDYQSVLGFMGIDITYNRNCYWMENLSSGIFGSKQLIDADTSQLGRDLINFYVEDFDGDGLKDLIYGFHSTWNKNLGDGTWSTSQPITYQSDYFSVGKYFVGDVNGDSKVEIISPFADASGQNLVAGHHGTNGEIDSIIYIANGYYYFSDINVIDINQDGNQDVLFCEENDNKLYISKNVGGLVFSIPEIVLTTSNPGFSATDYKIISTDFNNDGLIDIVFTSPVSFYYLKGQGEFNFQQPQRYSGIGEDVISIDYNNDMLVDLAGMFILTGPINEFGSIKTIKHSQNDSFDGYLYLSLDGTGNYPRLSDIDNDGDLDIYFYDGWYECLNTYPLEFSEFNILFDSLNYRGKSILGIYDFDNDGIKDFLIADNSLSDSLFFRINDMSSGSNSILSSIPIGSQSRIRGFLEIDFDLDGLLDFVVTLDTPNSDTTALFFRKTNTGNIMLIHTAVYENIGQSNLFVKPYDIDENGYPDILQSTPSGIICHLNMGAGVFSSPIQLTNENTHDFYLEDIDSDGIKDIIFTYGCCGLYNIAINWGEGNLNFSQADDESFIPVSAKSAFLLNDFDLDGDPDLIATVYADNEGSTQLNLEYFENNDGILQSNLTLNNVGSTWLNLSDLDNDNDMDVISVNGDLTRSVLINNTSKITFDYNILPTPDFKIFPNPSLNNVTLACSNCVENTKIEILNSLGELQEQHVVHSLNENLIQANLNTGLYFVRVTTLNKTIVKKLIIL